MVGGRIPLASESFGAPLGIVIEFVSRVEPLVLARLFGVAQFRIKELQVVMGRDVLGINCERSLESVDCFLPYLTSLVVLALPCPQPAEVKQCLPQEVDDFVIVTEIEPALLHIRRTIGEYAPQIENCFVQPALLAIDVAAEPGPRPARIAWLIAKCGRPLQRGHGFVEPPFGVVHAGQIHRPVPTFELLPLAVNASAACLNSALPFSNRPMP